MPRSLVPTTAPVLALLLGLVPTLVGVAGVRKVEADLARSRFAAVAQNHAVALQRALDGHALVLDAVLALYDASEQVTEEEFASFAAQLMDQRELRALEWAPLVTDAELAAFEAAEAAKRPGFHVRAPGGGAVEGAAEHAPVRFVEPLAGNEAVPGLDLLAEARRAAALDGARKADRALTSAPLDLVQGGEGPGLLLVREVHHPAGPRAGTTLGWVIAVVDLPAVVVRVLGEVPGGELVLTLREPGAATPLLVAEESGRVRLRDGEGAAPIFTSSLHLPGRALEASLAPREAFAEVLPPAALLLGLAGAAASVALAAWARSAALRDTEGRRRERELAERVAERTRALSETAASLADESRERERAELAERAGRQHLEALLGRMPGAIWTAGPDLEVTSRAGARLDDFFLGGDGPCSLPERWAAPPLDGVLAAHRAPGPTAVEVDLHGRSYEVVVEPARDPVVGGTVTVALDVTARRRLEAARIEAQALRAQKLESLGILAGGIAHDFNNLLVGVLGNVGLLRELLPPAGPAHAAADRIDRAAQQAAVLTRQILAYSGKGHFVIGPVDLGALMRDLADLVSATTPKKIEVRLQLAPGLPAVEADAGELRQLLLNLVTNAADAIGAGAGHIGIRTWAEHLDREKLDATPLGGGLNPGTYVGLEVADDGCGMDEATQSRMFDPFFTTKEQGHGLGLAAAIGILRGHRATVAVNSHKGGGTRIRVWFPASLRMAPERTPELTPRPVVRRGRKFLVIDDEEAVRSFFADALATREIETELEADGKAGVDRYATDPWAWDLVILDVTMPVMDGREAFRELRKLNPDQRVLVTSGYSERETMSDFPGARVSFLRKPFTLGELFTSIDLLLRR